MAEQPRRIENQGELGRDVNARAGKAHYDDAKDHLRDGGDHSGIHAVGTPRETDTTRV